MKNLPSDSSVCLDHHKIGNLPNADFNEGLPKAGSTGAQVPGPKNKFMSSIKSPDSDHVHAVYSEMTGQ